MGSRRWWWDHVILLQRGLGLLGGEKRIARRQRNLSIALIALTALSAVLLLMEALSERVVLLGILLHWMVLEGRGTPSFQHSRLSLLVAHLEQIGAGLWVLIHAEHHVGLRSLHRR